MVRNGDGGGENSADEELVKRLANRIKTHTDWRYRETTSPFEEQLERSVAALETGATVEYWFDHRETTGTLRVEIPAEVPPETVLTGTLNQALDRREQPNPETDSFLNQLIQKQNSIVEKHNGEYISPVSDPVSIVRMEVPYDYSPGRVTATLTRVSSISNKVQKIHDEIWDLLHETD